MNNRFKQFCNSIDYNTYQNICRVIGNSSMGIILTNTFLLPQNLVLNIPIDILTYISLAIYSYMSFSEGRFNTRDVNEIKMLYQEVINNYNKLNKIFDFNDPIQIYAMFDYLLYKGYLSKNKEFEFTNSDVKDITPIFGANVTMGRGVCRHISAMLVDILNVQGIDAFNLGCYAINYKLNIKKLEKQKYSKDELISFINNYVREKETQDILFELVERCEQEGIFIELVYDPVKDKNLIRRYFGNHAICFAVKDGKNYFLDPANSSVYRLSEEGNGILVDDKDEEILIKVKSSKRLNDKNSYLELKSKLIYSNENISFEEGKNIIDSTVDLCKKNIDVFEHFYDDNSEIYDEISNKLTKIKTRINK